MQAPFERDGGKDNGELDQRLAVLCLAWRPLRCRPNSCHARDCPCDRAISTASPTSPTPPAEARPVSAPTEGAPPGSSIAGNWSGQLAQVGSQTPYKFELVIGRKEAQTTYPDSTARERLLASGRRNPMPSSSRSLLRARLTKVDAVPTVPSRLPEQKGSGVVLVWEYRSQHDRRLRHSLKKVAWTPVHYANPLTGQL
jgi:hypothetical protein